MHQKLDTTAEFQNLLSEAALSELDSVRQGDISQDDIAPAADRNHGS